MVEQADIMNCSIGWGQSDTGSGLRMEVSNQYQYVDYPYFHQYWYPHHTILFEDTTEKAFRIAKALMKKKLVKLDKVKDFVMLVDEILEIL